MNFKNMAGVAVLVLAVAFAMQLVQKNAADAYPSTSKRSLSAELPIAGAVQYATLEVSDSGEEVTWRIGGNDRVRVETIRVAYRRLGGDGKETFANLLNQIGSAGWTLVQKDGNLWIFLRRV